MSTAIQNLREAITRESNAKRRYELYAEKAKEENAPETIAANPVNITIALLPVEVKVAAATPT
ncbi:MAG: hypothetical protein ACFFBK_14970 [Promethearchaeota archaeon]